MYIFHVHTHTIIFHVYWDDPSGSLGWPFRTLGLGSHLPCCEEAQGLWGGLCGKESHSPGLPPAEPPDFSQHTACHHESWKSCPRCQLTPRGGESCTKPGANHTVRRTKASGDLRVDGVLMQRLERHIQCREPWGTEVRQAALWKYKGHREATIGVLSLVQHSVQRSDSQKATWKPWEKESCLLSASTRSCCREGQELCLLSLPPFKFCRSALHYLHLNRTLVVRKSEQSNFQALYSAVQGIA